MYGILYSSPTAIILKLEELSLESCFHVSFLIGRVVPIAGGVETADVFRFQSKSTEVVRASVHTEWNGVRTFNVVGFAIVCFCFMC